MTKVRAIAIAAYVRTNQRSEDDGPKSRCSFQFFGQTNPTDVPRHLMKELEDEIDNPTGISTVSRPNMFMEGVLISKNCGLLLEFKEVRGVKCESLYTHCGESFLNPV